MYTAQRPPRITPTCVHNPGPEIYRLLHQATVDELRRRRMHRTAVHSGPRQPWRPLHTLRIHRKDEARARAVDAP